MNFKNLPKQLYFLQKIMCLKQFALTYYPFIIQLLKVRAEKVAGWLQQQKRTTQFLESEQITITAKLYDTDIYFVKFEENQTKF